LAAACLPIPGRATALFQARRPGTPFEPARRKRAKFTELAERRTSNAIKAIEIVGHLGNRANYEFNELGVRKTVVALETAVKTVKAKMNAWGKGP